MGPLEMIYSWQAMLVACIAWMVTQFVKTAIDIHAGHSVIQKQSMLPPAPESATATAEVPGGTVSVTVVAAPDNVTYRDSAKPVPIQAKAQVGREARRDAPILNRIVLPVVPVLVAALIGAFIPVHPEVLQTYVESKIHIWWQADLVYAMWGAVCGQFSSYIFDKVSKGVEAFRLPRPSTGS